MEKIISMICGMCGVKAEEVLGEDKSSRVSIIRQLVWRCLYKEGYTLRQIGDRFKRKHNVILYGIKRIDGMLEVGDTFVNNLLWKIENEQRTQGQSKEASFVYHYCARLGVKASDVICENRDSDVALLRFIIYHDMFTQNVSCSNIARIFKRSRQSVHHGINRFRDLKETGDKKLTHYLNQINHHE